MNPFDVGDPYIEWNEVNSAQDETPIEEKDMFEVSDLRDAVVKRLMSEHDFLVDDAEEAVKDSFTSKPEFWNENADANDLANLLASDDGYEVI